MSVIAPNDEFFTLTDAPTITSPVLSLTTPEHFPFCWATATVSTNLSLDAWIGKFNAASTAINRTDAEQLITFNI